ncbi:DUF6279 family lipoprotein [Povalibacter sp.]|uniref:DUF6279 family lipoprotein n=1 Tax=Povalibacter sp. TaxID=1962978 RepID=UPI002F41DA5D
MVQSARLRLRTLAVCVVALLTTACSSSFVYNRLDTLAGWYLGSLVSLDEDQERQLQQWLTQTLDWHRRSELTRYAGFLRDLSQQMHQPGTPSTYAQTQQRFEEFWQELVTKTTPQATTLLQGLSIDQTNELVRNLDEKARDRAADEASDPGKWQRDQIKRLSRFVRRCTGSVSNEQLALITATASQLEPSQAEWLASQDAWRRALQSALMAEPSADRTHRIEQLLARANNEWTQEYVDKSQRNRQRHLDLVRSLDATLSSRQRKHLQSELLKLAGQLDSIAGGKS